MHKQRRSAFLITAQQLFVGGGGDFPVMAGRHCARPDTVMLQMVDGVAVAAASPFADATTRAATMHTTRSLMLNSAILSEYFYYFLVELLVVIYRLTLQNQCNFLILDFM